MEIGPKRRRATCRRGGFVALAALICGSSINSELTIPRGVVSALADDKSPEILRQALLLSFGHRTQFESPPGCMSLSGLVSVKDGVLTFLVPKAEKYSTTSVAPGTSGNSTVYTFHSGACMFEIEFRHSSMKNGRMSPDRIKRPDE